MALNEEMHLAKSSRSKRLVVTVTPMDSVRTEANLTARKMRLELVSDSELESDSVQEMVA